MIGYTWRVDSAERRRREQMRQDAENKRRAAQRHAFRLLPRALRIMKDMDIVQQKLLAISKATNTPLRLQKYGPAEAARQSRVLLRRWNRLMDAYNKAIAL